MAATPADAPALILSFVSNQELRPLSMQIATPRSTDPVQPAAADGAPSRFWLVAAIASLGGLLFGYDTGIIAGALLFIREDFALSEWMEGLVAGAVLVGAVGGVAIGGQLADRFGRRLLIFACAVLFVISSALCAVAPGIGMLVAGRVLVGMAVGVASMVTPIYLAEISPPAQRGTIVTFNSLCIVTGMLGSYLLSWSIADWAYSWRWMLGFGVLPGALLALGILLLPASPRWLAAQGRFDEAREVLARMRPDDAIDAELRLLRRDARAQGTEARWSTLLQPRYRRVLLVGLLLPFFQQATGINAVLYFAPRIFERAGADTPARAILATAAVGAVNVLFTLVALRLMDRAGRRPLLLWGIGGMTLMLTALSVGSVAGASSLVFAATCLCGFIAFFAFSLGACYYVLASEIFPQAIRGRAMSLSAGMMWVTNLAVTVSFPVLNDALGNGGAFGLFAAIGVAALLFVWRRVPETRGRSLEQIDRLFSTNPQAKV
ncbi:sugar porter family MFS transporter [Sphingomonas sp. PL-96]|uniref:sugar porter family MFS transporter n=1 Tax=Sphingomonas sp. PL-96 TaxID=2887201 RepID=UPI001E3E092C|nr:sugar porter family MFS transporter [Sphingomonas sp. PL-96]MCC2978006.1 sugar porter family MFS transporter [Sphingomonas sp. PL-96]